MHAGGSRGVDKVISGVCLCLCDCVSVCLSVCLLVPLELSTPSLVDTQCWQSVDMH